MPVMTPKRVIWTGTLVLAAAAIPAYGALTGRWAEMMGGRMMVWGFAWVAILMIELILVLAIAARAGWKRLGH